MVFQILLKEESALRKFKNEGLSPSSPGIIYTDHLVERKGVLPDLKLRSYRPKDCRRTLPCLYYIHGGGMIMGTVENDDVNASMLSEKLQSRCCFC